jgi:hypothetical protein
MPQDIKTAMQEVRTLMDEYRAESLWYMRKDYYPQNIREAIRILKAIEEHSDLAGFKRAATLRQWLSHHTSATSAG